MNLDMVTKIIDGYSHLIAKDKRVEQIALKRSTICSSCDQLSSAHGFYLHCKKCGCYIPAKVRSLTSFCPLKKWNTEEKQPDYI